MDVRNYQKLASKTKFAKDTDAYFLGLIGEVGSIFSAHKKTIRSSANKKQIRAELDEQIGDAIWYLSAIASEYRISLDQILRNNLKKTHNNFIGDRTKHFDSKFPPHERLPRRINAKFTLIRGNKVRLTVNGRQLGDDVDDNAMRPDGYRFHDVFHLSFAAYLSWSPVLRALLKAKRKSNPAVDNIQDGARAAAIEEAVSAFVFAEQFKYGGFDIPENIPYHTLEIIKRITASLEVGRRTIPDWRKAVSHGFRVFEQLKKNGGGKVTVDLSTREMKFRP